MGGAVCSGASKLTLKFAAEEAIRLSAGSERASEARRGSCRENPQRAARALQVIVCSISPLMASVSAAQFVPGSSYLSTAGATGSDSKTVLTHNDLKNQPITHCGLRSLNKLDMLQIKTNVRAATRQTRRKALKTEVVSPLRVIKCGSGMNLVFVGAEVGPWSKTGGLGDVLGGLPPAMAANGHRVMTVCPRYDQYKDAWDTEVLAEVKVGDRTETVRFFHCYKRGVDRVFVDHSLFLEKVWGKTGSKIYGPQAGKDYIDNQLRFSLLCQAALEAPRLLNLNYSKHFSGPYGEDVVFIANDWHTALLPCYLKSMYKPRGIYKNAKVAFCIHNIAYQGRFAYADFSLLNLPDQFRASFDFIDGYDKPVKGRKINWMKAGILESDRVVTVSPYYAEELISGVEKGVELDNIIRMIGITGIVNGMDVQEWNPASDKYLDVKYDATNVLQAKPLLKEALQAHVGLPIDRNVPVIGFIGRLEEQKGSDILAQAIPQFIHEDVQIIVLGTGKKNMEKQLEELEIKYPNKARGVAKFNVPLAHMITAGADFMVVPSRFEPCGLIQLHAMRYGTVPIVASTGGLVNTVLEGYTGFQMGAFNVECETVDPADVAAIAKTVTRALATFGTPALKEMIANGMAQDLSWKGPAKNWEKLLLNLEVTGSEPGVDGEEIAPLAKENVATP
ncbi:granule-bound starch synthase 1, chloroplastic/amyloplastic-like [Eucalyptus grandis]|uniref:granule-bound starch synthase 1, chloroplastic/amyloplastic-like n=1 Tax=Eucalyptus grandis TaxID=71139 RepID=UPI00192EF9FA|nr:granule-bound starch synthase 1, chloroplastic/amyloplastic-like [Eucalyptus grandis]